MLLIFFPFSSFEKERLRKGEKRLIGIFEWDFSGWIVQVAIKDWSSHTARVYSDF